MIISVLRTGVNQGLDQKLGRVGSEEGADLPDVIKEESARLVNCYNILSFIVLSNRGLCIV